MLLSDRPNLSQLKSFSIYGLFGFKNVEIPFDKEAVILIAENGSGKTTILNTLYYSISCRFDKLSTIEFESIHLKFTSGKSTELRKNDLDSKFNSGVVFDVLESLRSYVPVSKMKLLQKGLVTKLLSTRRIYELLARYEIRVPPQKLDSIEKIIRRARSNENVAQKSNLFKFAVDIQENLNESILYFPTYRRIEEDLKNLGYEEDKSERWRFNDFEQLDLFSKLNHNDEEGKLIQFGMSDVIDKFDRIKTDIKTSSLSLFSKVTGEILTQFVEGIEVTQEMRDSIQPDTLNIVLSRVGEKNISTSDREKIEKLVSSGNINQPEHNQLVYFLSKLVGLYEQQKEKDNSINQFATICNEYLSNKLLVYDEVNVDIFMLQTRGSNNASKIDMKNLSSGEKQIISLFSKIYLESSEDFILLFDEPELSLSIEWQRLLLPDILKSGKCKLLLAVTHSPFIFDNELDLSAHDLDNFVRES